MRSHPWKGVVRAALAAADKVVVLGVGNPDKGDDGAGIAAAESLRKRLSPARKRRVHVLIGEAAPENLTGKIRTYAPDLVVILDAAVGGFPPGTLFRVDPGKIADDGVTTHRISLRWLVRYIEESIGCPVIVLGIEPESVDFKEDISAAVKKGISSAVDIIVENVRPKVRSSSA